MLYTQTLYQSSILFPYIIPVVSYDDPLHYIHWSYMYISTLHSNTLFSCIIVLYDDPLHYIHWPCISTF